MKKIHVVVLIVLTGVVSILVFIFIQQWINSQQDTTAVVTQIRSLNRWETASFTVDKVIDQGNSGNFFQQFLFGNRILLIAEGQVIGGFDFSTLTKNDVQIQGSSITLTLPPPQILLTSLDNSKTRVYDRQQGLLVPSNNNLESDARLAAENSIRAAACSEGILTTSASNAKKQLTPILSAFGFTQITITIPEGKC